MGCVFWAPSEKQSVGERLELESYSEVVKIDKQILLRISFHVDKWKQIPESVHSRTSLLQEPCLQ